jgi:hypothetical protein
MARLRSIPLYLALLLASGCLFPALAEIRWGTLSVTAGYGYSSGPFWPGYAAPFFYDPWFGYPFYGPVYLTPQPDKGQVSLQSHFKDAEVYLDDAYAGTTASLKKFWLAPGVYELEVRPKNQSPQKKRIYVLTGKTLKVSLE